MFMKFCWQINLACQVQISATIEFTYIVKKKANYGAAGMNDDLDIR
jgi:hypothetical protein